MAINVEYATKEAYQQFRDVHKRFSYLGSSEPRRPIVDEKRFNELVDMGSMFVAFEGETLVGYAVVCGYEDGTCDISEIFVVPERRHKGYGMQIVQKIKEEAKKSELTKLKVFSVFYETDIFWMRKCNFQVEESGYLVHEI